MNKVAVFGKPGSGKSTFSRHLAAASNLPLHCLDLIAFSHNGDKVSKHVFTNKHDELLATRHWIIEGLGPIETFYSRLAEADTLVYIDLPYWTCYWLVTKRLLKGIFITPNGWPKGSSILKGSINSYKYLRLSPSFWNEDFTDKLQEYKKVKSVYVLKSLKEVRAFLKQHKFGD